MSASRVGHCLLSDPAGDLKSLLTSGLSALRVGHCLLSDLAGDFEKLINFWVVCSSCSSTSLYCGPLEEVKIKTVWSQDLGVFWSQDLELVELV